MDNGQLRMDNCIGHLRSSIREGLLNEIIKKEEK